MTTAPEIKLKRFLHFGRETPFYQPVDHLVKSFPQNCLTSVEELIADEKATDAVIHIVKAFSDGYSAHPQYLVYALAWCARQKTSLPLREAAYNAFKTICKSPQNMFLFIKFAKELSAPNSGWGHGWRRVVNDWYLNQEPLQLAECATRYRSMYLWSHKDILKLAHPATEDVAKQAVLKYIVFGLKEAQQEFGDKAAAQPVLQYLQTVEEFKHCKNEEQAARMLEQHHFSLEHVPQHLLKSKEVWTALVPCLPLDVLLKNLKRLARLRFLRGNHVVVARVLDALENQTALEESNVHPAQVLIALRNYELSGKLKYTPPDPSKEVKQLPQPNPKVIEALNTLLESSFKLLVSTGMRYMIVVDTRPQMLTSRCWQCQVQPLQAAALLSLCLVKAERDVMVMAFGFGTPAPVALEKSMSFKQAQDKLKEVPSTTMDLAAPIEWAEKTKKSVDVFIIVTDNHLRGIKVKPIDALKQYRTSLNIPNAKLVVCALSVPEFFVASPEDPGMLDVAGFDGQVPRIIEAFSRGAF
ncbi:RNA-binding protein Ro60 [Anabrus simplex]|uniref:RNA-binding protein Ro60 n=1 Tax=Anabrus simplex TaxID=316456 RepID=UPI0035A2EC9D